MKKNVFLSLLLMSVILFCAGCGETLRGAGKDVRRMGQGVKTIFVGD